MAVAPLRWFLVIPFLLLLLQVLGSLKHTQQHPIDSFKITAVTLEHTQKQRIQSSSAFKNDTATATATATTTRSTTTHSTFTLQNLQHKNHTDPLLPHARIIRPSNHAKPLLILLPGPPKTATTTLQYGLWQLRPELEADQYTFVGMSNIRYEPTSFQALIDPTCQKQVQAAWKRLHSNNNNNSSSGTLSDHVECWKSFLDDLQRLNKAGKHVIISDERLAERWTVLDQDAGRFHWRAVVQALQDWDVRVIVNHRRHVDWLVSAKKQFDKMAGRRGQWVVQGGNAMTPLFPALQRLVKQTRRYQNGWQTFSQYRKYFDHVTVWNLAAPTSKDLVSTFVCDILPVAPAACKASLKKPQIASNLAVSYDYDRVANAAAQAGLINYTRWNRGAVTQQFQAFVEQEQGLTRRDLPQTCPSHDDLQELLRYSLILEENMVPEFYRTNEGEAAHRRDFWKAVAEKKYCDADVEAVLHNETYKSFFLHLDRSRGN